VEEFEGKMNAEVRRQEKLNIVEERDFRRGVTTLDLAQIAT